MSFKDKLLQIYSRYGLTPTSLSKKLNYDKSEKIARLTRDENNQPGFEIIRDLVIAFPEIPANWWFTESEITIVEESRIQYGFCKECLKKEGVIEFLRKELNTKNKLISEYKRKLGYDLGEISQTG